MRVTVAGKPSGSATISQKLLADGSKTVTIVMDLAAETGQRAKVRQESVYDRLGNPVRKIQEITGKDGKRQNLVVVTFDSDGAIMTIQLEGDPKEKRVALQKGAPRSNPSEFWMIRDKPKIGSKATYYRFDVAAGRWTLTEAIYKGTKSIKIAGKQIVAHWIESTGEGSAYLDSQGEPLLIETGSLRMERINP
jgi:hypothetical protein